MASRTFLMAKGTLYLGRGGGSGEHRSSKSLLLATCKAAPPHPAEVLWNKVGLNQGHYLKK